MAPPPRPLAFGRPAVAGPEGGALPSRRTLEALRELAGCYAIHLPIAVLTIAYFVRFALLSVQVQDGYGAPGYDMGIFDQGVWLLSRFHAPFVTVMGRDLFGDHTSFVLLLAVPLYWLWPEAQTLLVLQAGLLAAAAVPIYLLGLRRTGRWWLATGLAAAYLLNPALQNGNLEQFHPECFLVFFIAVAIFAAVEWHPRLLLAASTGCLLVKEDTALLIVPLAVWVFLRRDRRIGAGLAAAGVAYALVATQVVIRNLLGTSAFYSNRIPFGGLSGLAAAPFVHTRKFFDYVASGYKPFYMWQMGASFGWAFWWAPEIALVGLLTFAENFLSLFPYMQQIQYHYSLPIVPVFAMGTVWAVGRLPSLPARALATGVATGAAVISCYMWGLAPFSRHPVYPHAAPTSAAVRAENAALRAVPPAAVVSAAYPYVSHLDHRVYCYQWPTPFRATYWGLYNQEGQRLPFAGRVQWLVIDSQLSPDDQAVFDRISPQFRYVTGGGGVSVYQRVGPGS